MIAPVLALTLLADTVLVDVRVNETGARQVVEAVLTTDSTLYLPAADVSTLLGVRLATAYVTPRDLERAFPTVVTVFDPRALTLWVHDPNHMLPTTQRFFEGVDRQARAAPEYVVTTGGPYLALAADAFGRQRIDVGYSWKGKAFAGATSSTSSGTTFTATLAPFPAVFASYSGGGLTPPTVTARAAVGFVFIAPTWSQGRTTVDALAAVGELTLFASTRDLWILTLHSRRGGDVQLGRSAGVTSARVIFGNLPASPFLLPQTR